MNEIRAEWGDKYFDGATKPCEVVEEGSNSLLVTAPEEERFEQYRRHDSVLAFRQVRVTYEPESFRVWFQTIAWEGEDEYPSETLSGEMEVGNRDKAATEDGLLWWYPGSPLYFSAIKFRVTLPQEWQVRSGEKVANLICASDGSNVGQLPVKKRILRGPEDQFFADNAATVDQRDGDIVVRYETGQNGRITTITFPLPESKDDHSFTWDGDGGGQKGAEKLPRGWFYGIGRQLGGGAKFGSAGSDVPGLPAASHSLSDFGSKSLRVVSKETYARLLAAIPAADQAEAAA